MQSLITLALLALHGAALSGWGRALTRRLGLELSLPLMAALGLAAVIVLGGVLNLCGWATPLGSWTTLVVGLALAGRELRNLPARRNLKSLGPRQLIAASAWLLCAVSICATILPTATFNYHDDYQKYFAHPVRMRETGRVSGSHLSAIGFETLGGQAWLHGFVLNVASPEMLNAVDLGVGLLLGLALVLFRPGATRREWVAQLTAAGSLLMINPQIMNVSALYDGAALCAALFLLHVEASGDSAGPSRALAWASGLLAAALLALKTSFLPPVAAGAASLALALALYGCRARGTLAWLAHATVAMLVCLAPWLLVHAGAFWRALGTHSAARADWPRAAYGIEPFSFRVYGYGDGFAPYTWCLLGCVAASAIAFACAPRNGERKQWGVYAALAFVSAACLTYVSMLYVIGPSSQGELTALRLFIPTLLGIMPGLYIVVARALAPRSRLHFALCSLLLVAPVSLFVPSALARAWQAIARGSVLAYSELDEKPWYVAYNREVLHGGMQREVRSAQAAVPAGAPLVAWINAPFYLDYRRNPISDLENAGLETPWTEFPDARHVLWEFNGVATGQIPGYQRERTASGRLQARIADAGLRLTRTLIALHRRARVLFDDRRIMVLELPSGASLRDGYDDSTP